VDAVITHALFPPEMTRAFSQAGIRSIRSSHSVPHPTNAIPLDAILGAALLGEFHETRPGRAT
jgi:ribose-phosphate pyrophosphokinase